MPYVIDPGPPRRFGWMDPVTYQIDWYVPGDPNSALIIPYKTPILDSWLRGDDTSAANVFEFIRQANTTGDGDRRLLQGDEGKSVSLLEPQKSSQKQKQPLFSTDVPVGVRATDQLPQSPKPQQQKKQSGFATTGTFLDTPVVGTQSEPPQMTEPPVGVPQPSFVGIGLTPEQTHAYLDVIENAVNYQDADQRLRQRLNSLTIAWRQAGLGSIPDYLLQEALVPTQTYGITESEISELAARDPNYIRAFGRLGGLPAYIELKRRERAINAIAELLPLQKQYVDDFKKLRDIRETMDEIRNMPMPNAELQRRYRDLEREYVDIRARVAPYEHSQWVASGAASPPWIIPQPTTPTEQSTNQSLVSQPVINQPLAEQLQTGQFAVNQPTMSQLQAGQIATGQSMTGQTATGQTVIGQRTVQVDEDNLARVLGLRKKNEIQSTISLPAFQTGGTQSGSGQMDPYGYTYVPGPRGTIGLVGGPYSAQSGVVGAFSPIKEPFLDAVDDRGPGFAPLPGLSFDQVATLTSGIAALKREIAAEIELAKREAERSVQMEEEQIRAEEAMALREVEESKRLQLAEIERRMQAVEIGHRSLEASFARRIQELRNQLAAAQVDSARSAATNPFSMQYLPTSQAFTLPDIPGRGTYSPIPGLVFTPFGGLPFGGQSSIVPGIWDKGTLEVPLPFSV